MPLIPNLETRLPSKPTAKSFDALATQCPPTQNVEAADIAIISDTPSSIEIMEKQPFSGPTGSQLNRLFAAANIPRYKCYLTHACKAMLPNNNTNKLWTDKGWRCPEWAELQERLIAELEKFNGKLIIPMGLTAMKLLIDDPRFDKISKYRGSIYPTSEFPHLAERLPNKLLCLTFHPSSSLPKNNPINFWIILMDLRKFLKLDDNPELLIPEPEIHTRPTFTEVMSWYARCKNSSEVAFDIEATPRFTTCFSLAFEPTSAMSIPLMDNRGNYWTPTEEVQIWKGLAEILINPDIAIICQNGMFDLMFLLRTMNIISDAFSFDTMLAQHIAYTDLPKGLDFLTSAYTYFPYYKDEGKQAHLKVIKDWESYWRYNAKDSAYLLMIKENQIKELDVLGDGAHDALEYSMNLHKPLMEMEFNGILTDRAGINKRKKTLYRVIGRLQKALDRIVGHPLNVGSSKQMIDYFYHTLKIAPYKNRKTGRPSCDATALSRIAKKKRPKIAVVVAKIILKLRQYKKLTSTYFDMPLDPDNRLRCGHKITGTVSGRIATARTFFGTGTNLQNQPYAFKKYLIPDPDYLIGEVDLAKAEAHVVAFLAQDANMIAAFESGVDVHSFNASKIFDIPIEAVTKAQRTLGKKVVHASNYSMGPGTFSNTLAKDNVFMSMGECKKLLNAYSRRFPGLKHWHKSIEQEIYQSRMLYNLYGRPKRFLGMLNDSLLRNAYSYKPQSTVAELLNRGTIKMTQEPKLGVDGYDIDLLTTVHDSTVFQFHKKHLPNLLDLLKTIEACMYHKFHHKGRSFVIGLDAKIGYQWAGQTVEIAKFEQPVIDKALEGLGV